MYCNYCRALNPDDSVYCSACGRTIKFAHEETEDYSQLPVAGAHDTPIPEISESESVAEPCDETFSRDYERMDDEELTQLQEAYYKLGLPLPDDLRDYLESQALIKELEAEGNNDERSQFNAGDRRTLIPGTMMGPTNSEEASPALVQTEFSNINSRRTEPTSHERVRWWWYLVGPTALVLFAALTLLLIYGLVWVSAKLYPIVEVLSLLGLLVFMVCLPLSLFRRIRRLTGKGLVNVSYLWGLGLWMYAVLVLYDLWGFTGIYIGFFTLGYVTLPLACLAVSFKGEWSLLGQLVLWFVIVFSTRMLGYWIISKGPEPAE